MGFGAKLSLADQGLSGYMKINISEFHLLKLSLADQGLSGYTHANIYE